MELDKAKEYLVRRISPGESFEDLLRFPRFLEIETVNACNAVLPDVHDRGLDARRRDDFG